MIYSWLILSKIHAIYKSSGISKARVWIFLVRKSLSSRELFFWSLWLWLENFVKIGEMNMAIAILNDSNEFLGNGWCYPLWGRATTRVDCACNNADDLGLLYPLDISRYEFYAVYTNTSIEK
jgi:hypothetical protein